MKRVCIIVFALAALLVSSSFAQAPAGPPKPGPELKRLAYYVGKWSTEADMKESAFGPAGKFTGTERIEWFPGRFFVVIHSDAKGPMGDMKSLEIMGYDKERKVYTFDAINSMGEAEHATGSVNGDTWTWNSDSKMNGKNVKAKFTIKEESPTVYSYSWEGSFDGGAMTKVMEGKSTKMDAPPPPPKKVEATKK